MKKIIILLFSLSLVSCGPVYTTQYKYTPPNNQRGRSCVNQCINDKYQCYNNCSNKYYVCKQHVRTALDEMNFSRTYKKQKCNTLKFKKTYKKQKCNTFDMAWEQEKMPASLKLNMMCENEKTNCTSQCDKIFNQCYSICGGKRNSSDLYSLL